MELSVGPYHSSLLEGFLDSTQYPHKANVCKSLSVGQHLCIYV